MSIIIDDLFGLVLLRDLKGSYSPLRDIITAFVYKYTLYPNIIPQIQIVQ